jgi:hypothetical protein
VQRATVSSVLEFAPREEDVREVTGMGESGTKPCAALSALGWKHSELTYLL